MQLIRETIKTSSATEELLKSLEAAYRKIYYCLMDSDHGSLRVHQAGFFEKVDLRVRCSQQNISVITLGYAASDTERPLTKLANRLDMAVREAMTDSYPNAPYYPEPFLGIYLKQGRASLQKLRISDGGTKLESRRLIASGIKSGVINKSLMRFWANDGLPTRFVPRMIPSKAAKVNRLTLQTVGDEDVLRSLRGCSQTHIFPKKWAEQLYLDLPIRCRVTNVTKHLMKIFSLCDPIELGFAMPKALGVTYTPNWFAKSLNIHRFVMLFYFDVEAPEDGPIIRNVVESLKLNNPSQETGLIDFFSNNQMDLCDAMQALMDLGLDALELDKIEATARESGESMMDVFEEMLS